MPNRNPVGRPDRMESLQLYSDASFSSSAVFTWTNLLVVVVELDGSEQEALDLVPLVTNVVLEEHYLVVGVVVVVMCLSGYGKEGYSLNGAGLATEVSFEHRLKEGFVCLSVSAFLIRTPVILDSGPTLLHCDLTLIDYISNN